MSRIWIGALALWLAIATGAAAEPGRVGLFADRQPMFGARPAADAPVSSASLFVARPRGGLFAPRPERLDRPWVGAMRRGSTAKRLRDLIARAEAGRAGYDAVQHGARIQPPTLPTRMTLGEIDAWIDATPGQPHAIGRYQFIPSTLRRLVARLDLPPQTRFSPAIQDRLGDLLLADAGLAKVQSGAITREAFMLNLARIWAGLPTENGRSYYHGLAGNKATMSYATYTRQVTAILGG